MLKLRAILLCNYPYYLLLILVLIISTFRLLIPRKSHYNHNKESITGVITSYTHSEESFKITLKNKEKLLVYYYPKKGETINFSIGDEIKVIGQFNIPQKNTTKYLFNYQEYLYNKGIFYTISATSIKKISSTKNIYYKIKQIFLDLTKNSPYLRAFILGDKSLISPEVTRSYQENGISHLLAISGMHITLLSQIILKLLTKLKLTEEKRYLITSLFLIFYLALIGLSPSALRGVLFFLLFSINKIYYFYVKPINIFITVLSITLLINPYFIYNVGFQYSFLISMTLILNSHLITGNYLIKLLKTSTISFVISIPISLYNYYQINFMSIIYNLFFVPLISVVIFPMSLVTLLIKPLMPIYNILILVLEKTSLFIGKISFGKLIFPRITAIIYIIYLILIIFVFIKLNKKDIKPLILLLILLFIHYLYPLITNAKYLQVIDVGQGDSLLLHSGRKDILIDTGGKMSFSKNNNSTVAINTTIPYLKSKGIKKIDYLILTHGDYDHMGEAINLVNNFKVDKVIFNCGEYNDLEKELIKVLEKKKIPYYSCIKELNIDDNKLYFLNNKDYGNENDNSSVIYTELNGYKFMFMGDASVTTEKEILSKYNLSDIDILKVGHHGSRTSSSIEFINEINPKFSIISVGKKNRYGHPNKEVLENLEKSRIYRTDQDGSIMFKIKNNKLKIETCSP